MSGFLPTGEKIEGKDEDDVVSELPGSVSFGGFEVAEEESIGARVFFFAVLFSALLLMIGATEAVETV